MAALVALFAAACGSSTLDRNQDPGFEEFVPDFGADPSADAGPVPAADAGPGDAATAHVLVTSILPNRGPTTGGARVVLVGKNFANGFGDADNAALLHSKTTIRFGGNPALDFRVIDDDTIEVTSPTGIAGDADVSVQNPNGTGVCAGCFRYFEPIVLKTVSPGRGSTADATPVVLTGSGFEEGVQVLFGTRSAASVRVVSPTRIEARAPPASAGAVDVAVAGRAGLWSLRRAFLYFDPVRVDAVDPPVGPLAGGNNLVIHGAGFTVGSVISVGGLACAGASLDSDGTLSCQAPPSLAPGAADVTVRTGGVGEASLAGGYAYADPTTSGFALYSITPRDGPASGGGTAVVTGQGFRAGGFGASIGGAGAPLVAIVSDWQATVTVPRGAPGLADVQVRTDLGAGSLGGGYRYDFPITIATVTPGQAPASGTPAVQVTLVGSGFDGRSDTVSVGGMDATIVSVTSTQIVFIAPAGGEGPAEVVVRSPASDGHLREARAPFTFTAPLRLLNIEPSTGALAGGQLLTVIGSGFTPATRILFGSRTAAVVGAVSANKLVVRTPPGDEGQVDVVAGDDAASDALAHGFTYYDPTAPFGGLTGGPMGGTLNVVVQERDMHDPNILYPVPGARVFVGTSSPLALVTDARGMVTFSDPSLVKSLSVTITRADYASTNIGGVRSRNLTVYLTRNVPMQMNMPPPPPEPPPAFLSGRVYGFKPDERALRSNERWVARIYHAPQTLDRAPPYSFDLVEEYDPYDTSKEYGKYGYVTVTSEGGAYRVETYRGQQAMYAVFGVENRTTSSFAPYLMGLRQGIDGKPGMTQQGQDIVLAQHLDQTIPVTIQEPLSYYPKRVEYLVFPYLDLGGEGLLPVPSPGVTPDSPWSNLPSAYPAIFDIGDRHTLRGMPPVQGENMLFFVWAWSGVTDAYGQMDYPMSFQWRRQAGDLSSGLSVGPLLGFSRATMPGSGQVFGGGLAWTSGGAAADLAVVQLEERITTSMGDEYKPWLDAVAPGGMSSVTVPLEAMSAFPSGKVMRWTVTTAREPRFEYDNFSYMDVNGRGWTSWSVAQGWTRTP